MLLSQKLMQTILNINPSAAAGGGSKSPEDVARELAEEMAERMPNVIPTDEEDVNADTYANTPGTDSRNALGVYVEQEVERMNELVKEVKVTLHKLILALQGLEVFSPSLEHMFNCFLMNRLPDQWKPPVG